LQEINSKWGTLSSLCEKTESTLDESICHLDNEEKDDLEMQTHFKEKWSRLPSRELTGMLRDTATIYKEKLTASKKSDELIKSRIDAASLCILTLSRPVVRLLFISLLFVLFIYLQDEIEFAIPSPPTYNNSNMEILNELQQLLQQMDQVLNNRKNLAKDLMSLSFNDDIESKLMGLNNREKELDEDGVIQIIQKNMKQYEPLKKSQENLLQLQESLLSRILVFRLLFQQLLIL
jgi:hypothetical protein